MIVLKTKFICDNQSNDSIDYDLTNPATGPLYIEEAEAGDILKVSIFRYCREQDRCNGNGTKVRGFR